MKASDFLVGLRELLAFVVPGLAVILLLPPKLVEKSGRIIGQLDHWPDNDTVDIFLIFFAAYALGALLSGVGSAFDEAAEKVKGAKTLFAFLPPVKKAKLAEEDELEKLSQEVAALKTHIIGSFPTKPDEGAFGDRSFWWNYLRTHHPNAVAEVDRLEAQQKMFRSLLVAALLLALFYGAVDRNWMMISAFVVAAFVFFVTYAQIRSKTVRRIFQLAAVMFVPKDLSRAKAKGDAG